MHPFHMEISKEAWDVMAHATPGDDPALLTWAAGAAKLTWPYYFSKARATANPIWGSEAARWEMWEQGFALAPGRYCRFTNYFEVADSPSIGFGRVSVRVPWTACAALMRTADPKWEASIDAMPDDAAEEDLYALGWRIWDTLRPAARQLDLLAELS